MTAGPKVSIVIPVYNGSNFLAEAIDSALAQTYPHVEVLVVDDGSSDGGRTAAVVRRYGDRVRCLSKARGGVASALNLGIRAMNGQYFSWLSHDDIYYPDKIERQLEALADCGPDVIVYSDYELIDQRSRRLKRKILEDIPPDEFRFRLIVDTSLHGCTMLIPRTCLEAMPFDESLLTTQDYDLWFRLATQHRFVRVPRVLLKYRIHPGQDSWTNPRVVEEGNALLVGFLQQVSAAEVRRCTPEPLSVVYARVALGIQLRGFSKAAAHARALSARHAGSPRERLAPRRLAWLAAARLAGPWVKPMYWWKRLHFRSAPA